VGRETDSSALLADAAHLRTDVYTSMGVLVGLGLVHFTGVDWLDPASALAVALLIVLEAWRITSRTVGELLDRGLPPEERQKVERVLADEGISFHALRSRKSGPTRKLDLHLDVPPKATAEEVHALCDRLEEGVQRVLPGAQVLIHPEPMRELDRTSPAVEIARELLEGHRELFVAYHDLHAHEEGGQVHISLRLRLEPGTTVEELQALIAHLTGHLRELVPEAELYVHPEAGE
jgi:divalent metal cation (Fe/Co/Zn/Cd) transporter